MKKYKGLYSLSNVNDVIPDMISDGYEMEIIDGSLIDNYVMISPDDRPSWMFKETYLNEWSSAYTVIRLAKKDINKALQGRI